MGYGDATRIKTLSGVTAAELGLSTDEDLTDLIDDLNDHASALIDLATGRDFLLHEDVTETLDGTGIATIRLLFYPVVALTSVTVDGTLLTAGTDFVQEASSGILRRIDRNVWRRDDQNVVVVYDHGYATPPKTIVRIAEDLVIDALLAGKRNRAAAGASSIAMDGFSVSFSDLAGRMMITANQEPLLSRYRRIGCA